MTLTRDQRALLDDIASQAELAVQLGVSRSLLAMWITRYDDFPAPVLVLATGRCYRLSEVERWHAGRGPSSRRRTT